MNKTNKPIYPYPKPSVSGYGLLGYEVKMFYTEEEKFVNAPKEISIGGKIYLKVNKPTYDNSGKPIFYEQIIVKKNNEYNYLLVKTIISVIVHIIRKYYKNKERYEQENKNLRVVEGTIIDIKKNTRK